MQPPCKGGCNLKTDLNYLGCNVPAKTCQTKIVFETRLKTMWTFSPYK
jgi:hypothetical protein